MTCPTPKIRNVSNDGEVHVQWNVELIKPNSQEARMLSFKAPEDCFAVTIAPGKGDIYSSYRNLNFSFKVSRFEHNFTVLKLDFDKPSDVSTS